MRNAAKIFGLLLLFLFIPHPSSLRPAAAASAAENYVTYCALCHLPGIHGAPKVGDREDWARRIRPGIGMVHRNAVEGMPNTAMLALGGAPLSPAEVRAIADYMVAAAGLPASALKDAARYDHDVLVEPGVDAREVECAVLGGHAPQASVLGEIRYSSEFYDYEAKYAAESTQLVIPAELTHAQSEEMRTLALRAFRALKCWGMARVDFFLERKTGRVLLNELNTLPGFTDGSMYPRLWAATGIALPELVDRLIELALERQRIQSRLVVRFTS